MSGEYPVSGGYFPRKILRMSAPCMPARRHKQGHQACWSEPQRYKHSQHVRVTPGAETICGLSACFIHPPCQQMRSSHLLSSCFVSFLWTLLLRGLCSAVPYTPRHRCCCCCCCLLAWLSASNGCFCVQHSYSTTPSAHTSDFSLYGLSSHSSGDR